MDLQSQILFIALAAGGAIGLFVWGALDMARETVSGAAAGSPGATVTKSRFFKLLYPLVRVASQAIAKLPGEAPNEALGLADESLKKMSFARRGRRLLYRAREILRKKLQCAGKIDVFSPDDMLGSSVVSAGIWALVGLYFAEMEVLSHPMILLWGFFGAYFPVLTLNQAVKKRSKQILKAMPYSIDLLALSMDAGLDFTTSLGRIVDRHRGTPIGEEFGEMLRRVKIGETRKGALKNLADRLNLEDVTSFANSLIQADELGTPISQILRIQSDQMRMKRFQRAEELAGKAPVKILFPLVFFIMPTVFLVLFGPILLSSMGMM